MLNVCGHLYSAFFCICWYLYLSAGIDNTAEVVVMAECYLQRENFKHMKANAHPVFYRIQTDSNRRHRQGQSG